MIDRRMTSNAFTLEYDYITNLIVTNAYVSDAMKKIPAPDSGEPEALKCRGLWDTGASNSVISKRLVDKLNLPAISKVPIIGVNGKFITTSHVIDLWLPNNYVVRRINVTMGTLSSDFDILIGMDIIVKGDFSISNYQGHTVFSFRSPSMASTDYVKQIALIEQSHHVNKVSRNAPCPCGSGRKYKNCCGRII